MREEMHESVTVFYFYARMLTSMLDIIIPFWCNPHLCSFHTASYILTTFKPCFSESFLTPPIRTNISPPYSIAHWHKCSFLFLHFLPLAPSQQDGIGTLISLGPTLRFYMQWLLDNTSFIPILRKLPNNADKSP